MGGSSEGEGFEYVASRGISVLCNEFLSPVVAIVLNRN